MEAVTDLLYKLSKDYGIALVYFVLYVASIVFIMILRNKEMTKLVATVNALVDAFNNLRNSVDSNMRQTTLIMSAMISAISGDKKAAKNMINNVNAAEQNDKNSSKGNGEEREGRC